VWAAVDARAEADNVSASDVVRAALAAYLKIDESTDLVAGREDGRKVRTGRTKAADVEV